MQTNDYTKKAKLYALAKITETGYLAYRDILRFIPNELKKGKTLDFGCGSGRSTRFLRKRRYLGRYFAHPMMQNRRAKRDDYKPSAVRVTQRCVP
ncbi:hypothetical protein PsalN5692_03145 [Piscirickettsia salmonis]|uniref:hypothetical protein n=1 Tax=Piscirickettsia salmonis TaxID=1238 RepID=UPI0012B7DD98|nr:hypothetical protein [Piscirickettsia salmonis]QGP51658.1 hypothetical protein PsalN5692_03145 [Piscirickettsia salmonis]